LNSHFDNKKLYVSKHEHALKYCPYLSCISETKLIIEAGEEQTTSMLKTYSYLELKRTL